MIRHRTARRIACDWHGGQSSALYALCSSGAIDGNGLGAVGVEIRREIAYCRKQTDQRVTRTARREAVLLGKLLAYVHHHGNRGPVEGWSRMPW